jgi:hypothetical protein
MVHAWTAELEMSVDLGAQRPVELPVEVELDLLQHLLTVIV